jgi:RNA polymerase sigma-70 factor (ECF subfamily)
MSFSGEELQALIPRLRRYAHALARHPVQPEDLIQDTLERAWSRRRQWQQGTDLRAWLFTILHNTFVSELRRFSVRGYDAESIDGSDRDVSFNPSNDVIASHAGVMLDIERALAALPVDQRAVVLLVGLEDLSYREAAEVLGIPVGTVMSRLARGRARLRDLMDGVAMPRRETASPETGDLLPASLKIVRREP